MSPYILWLALGVGCFFVEAMIVSGVGFLFAGLAALTAGSAITAFPELSTLEQWLVFFASGVLWALLLWRPLQKLRGKGPKHRYQNMIGDSAYIAASGLRKGETGEATWSGTIMKARMADDIHLEQIAGGTEVVIAHVNGNTLIVKPR